MEYIVVKVGAEMFDMLHACGLGIVLANSIGEAVNLKDEGPAYRLRSPEKAVPEADSASLLDQVLSLPTLEQLQEDANILSGDGAVANLDGLFATLFTVPGGKRVVSVFDLLNKQAKGWAIDPKSFNKICTAIARCRQYVKDKAIQPSQWLLEALTDYDSLNPKIPAIKRTGKHELSVPMPLDPSFSYSSSRSMSDGLITNKSNTAVRNTKYAPVFALVGAARFLRAQYVASNQVNFYVPVFRSLIVSVQKGS